MLAWLALATLACADPPPPPVVIGMGEYAVAKAPATPELGTAGVATCIAVFLYDPANKVGALGHFAADTDVAPSIKAMRGAMAAAGADLADLRATLIGGWDTSSVSDVTGFVSTSPQLLARIKTALEGVPIEREETLTVPFSRRPDGRPSIRNVVMDLDTGRVSDFTPGAPVAASDFPSAADGRLVPLRPHGVR